MFNLFITTTDGTLSTRSFTTEQDARSAANKAYAKGAKVTLFDGCIPVQTAEPKSFKAEMGKRFPTNDQELRSCTRVQLDRRYYWSKYSVKAENAFGNVVVANFDTADEAVQWIADQANNNDGTEAVLYKNGLPDHGDVNPIDQPKTRVLVLNDKGKFDIVENPLSKGPLFDELDRLSGGDKLACIKAIGTIEEADAEDTDDIERYKTMTAAWEAACHNGIKTSHGTYVPVGAGTNASKGNEVLFVLEQYVQPLDIFALCGANRATWKITPAKFSAYVYGLNMVGTKPWPIPMNPEDMLIVDELVTEHLSSNAMFVDATKGIIEAGERWIAQNEDDGFLIGHVSDKKKVEMLSKCTRRQERRALERAIDKFNNEISGFSCRAPYIKGMTMLGFDWHAYLHDQGIDSINGVDIDDIIVLANTTVFKASIGPEDCAYTSYAEYCEAFHKLGHRFGVLIEETEETLHNLPYQQIQSSRINGEELDAMYAHEMAYYAAYATDEGKISKLPGNLRKLVKNDRSLLAHPYIQRKLNEMFEKDLRETFAGKVHEASEFGFGAPDPIQFVRHAAGLSAEPVIPADCVIKLGSKHNNAKCIVSRNPNTNANALCEMMVYNSFASIGHPELDQYFSDNSVWMISCGSLAVTRMRGDYDGDHFWFTFVDWFVKAVEKIHAKQGVVDFDWNAPKPEKVVVTKEVLRDYFAHLTTISQLGYYNNLMTKGYAWFGDLAQEICAFGDFCINVMVDASKHGSVDFKMHPAFKQFRKAVTKLPLPKTIGETNARKRRVAIDRDRVAEDYLPGSISDQYAKTILAAVEKYRPVCTEEEYGTFDYRTLLTNEKAPFIYGLEALGQYAYGWHEEDGVMKPDGMIAKGYFMHLQTLVRDDMRAIQRDEKLRKQISNFRRVAGEEALEAIKLFALRQGCTLEDAYNRITARVFRNAEGQSRDSENKIAADMIWDWYFDVFGDMAADRQHNLEEAASAEAEAVSAEPVQPADEPAEIDLLDDIDLSIML